MGGGTPVIAGGQQPAIRAEGNAPGPPPPVGPGVQLQAARGIPERFLLKVLKPLADRGILRSMKGPNGGYRLARPASEINMLEILEAVDGPIRGLAPPTQDGSPLNGKLEVICKQAAEATRKHLEKVKMSELAVGKK